MVLDNTLLDLTKVKVPVTTSPPKRITSRRRLRCFNGSQFFGGPVRYVLAGSGHIAGVINPPANNKYQYWTNDNINQAYAEQLARRLRTSIRDRGGPIGGPGSRPRTPKPCRRASPVAA